MTSSAPPEDRSPVFSSVILLLVDIIGYGAFAIHTVLSRRRDGPERPRSAAVQPRRHVLTQD